MIPAALRGGAVRNGYQTIPFLTFAAGNAGSSSSPLALGSDGFALGLCFCPLGEGEAHGEVSASMVAACSWPDDSREALAAWFDAAEPLPAAPVEGPAVAAVVLSLGVGVGVDELGEGDPLGEGEADPLGFGECEGDTGGDGGESKDAFGVGQALGLAVGLAAGGPELDPTGCPLEWV